MFLKSRYISIHVAYSNLDPKALALLTSHAFTGYDVTTAFYNHREKTAWDAWQAFPELTIP